MDQSRIVVSKLAEEPYPAQQQPGYLGVVLVLV
jgi:hypothetical protein